MLIRRDIMIMVTVLSVTGTGIYELGTVRQQVSDIAEFRKTTLEPLRDEVSRMHQLIDINTNRLTTLEQQGSPALRAMTIRIDDLEKLMNSRFSDIGTRITESDKRSHDADDRLNEQLQRAINLLQGRAGAPR